MKNHSNPAPFIQGNVNKPHKMFNSKSLYIAFSILVFSTSVVEAEPISKCIVNGVVTFQQGPCSSDQDRNIPTIKELNAAEKKRRAAAASATAPTSNEAAPTPSAVSSGFRCDGRQYCSQMRSCAESKYFLANCPDVKMDGDNNGIPCEKQWCSHW